MRVVVIGAGAAGLVAAAEAAKRGADTRLLEKNTKIGVKILMSGGTRCNLTHDTDARGITSQFLHAKRFLQPSVGGFPPAAVVQMFSSAGVPTKVESTGKIFPVSNRAVHARDALLRIAVESGVQIQTSSAVTGVERLGQGWTVETLRGSLECDRVIVTAGGRSWPGCGTTGDAYAWLQRLGHRIVPPRPALVPLEGGAPWTHSLSGLTLEDCIAEVHKRNKSSKQVLASRRSSLLFTHFGFSGPAAMDVSGQITAADSFEDVLLCVDLVPNRSDADIQHSLGDRSGRGRQKVAAVIADWIPQRLAAALVRCDDQLRAEQTISELPRAALHRMVQRLKRLPLEITGTRGFAKAEVTAGGVALDQVDPKTMESRICDGLFIAGEVLDVDGPIGGYNFQAAFSTGRAAGIAAANRAAE